MQTENKVSCAPAFIGKPLLAPTPTSTPLATPLAKIRVLLVDDNSEAAEMLGRCINHEPDMESAGWLTNADVLGEQAASRQADVVMLDLAMPGKDPLDALREMTSQSAGESEHRAQVIVYSGHKDEQTRQLAFAAGAWKFMDKGAPISDVLEAIRSSARPPLSPSS